MHKVMAGNLFRNETERAFASDAVVQVLALDGGGLKGVFSASAIEVIEARLGNPICQHFDIVTGTSTGGLIALALAAGRTGEEIKDFYLQHGDAIFPSRGLLGFLRSFKRIFLSKYSNARLQATLQHLLSGPGGGVALLGDSTKRLVIPTYLAKSGRPRLLKTPHASRYTQDWRLPMWAVGMATTAAPTYLSSFKFRDCTYVDGGLWANNPSLIGAVEAMDLGAELPWIRVLNIGTTYSEGYDTYCYPLSRAMPQIRLRRAGIATWGGRILETVMEANSYATANMFMHQLLTRGNYATLNKMIPRKFDRLDKVDYPRFVEWGQSVVEEVFPEIESFFRHEAGEYIPNKDAMAHRDEP